MPFTRILEEEPPIPPLLGFVKTPHWERVTPEAKEAFGELIATLGDRVEEIDLIASAADAWEWQKTIMEAEMAANLEREWQIGRDKLSPQLRSLMERGRETKAIDYQRALAGIPRIVESFDELFTERYDAILTPAAPGSAPKGLGSTGDPTFCTLWTLCGMPAVTLPLMQDSAGLPIGVQLVGRKNFDARLLRTARWLAARLESA
jgi:Asp-tRNA(Asn)/Glu-tRNA(Gln) amidotransferase A subunit family amidase